VLTCRSLAGSARHMAAATAAAMLAAARTHRTSPALFAGVGLAAVGAGTACAASAATSPTALTGHMAVAPGSLTAVGDRHRIARARPIPAPARPPYVPLADRLIPVGTSGPQAWMQISAAQWANAATIVDQAMAKGMGVRSAVIAVATAMQESQLLDVGYGTSDSLGLFQQQPDCGWGSAQQLLDPAYAADAFLDALAQHQASDPGWAAQPLWANAQAVQNSAFPFAYARWEAQAAHLVYDIVH